MFVAAFECEIWIS